MACWKKIALLCFSFWVLVTGLPAQEGRIVISGKDAWLPDLFDKVHFKQTEDAESTVTLVSKEHPLQEGVDLLLHFNGEEERDETGNYQIVRQPIYSGKNVLFGKAAGFFQGRGGVFLRPGFSTFLGHGITNHDFSINFWFYPFFVKNGEVLFEWEGQLVLNGKVIPQRISAVFRANRVVWHFRNVFLSPDQDFSLYEVSSDPYIPENWYHHQLIYDEDNAMLEVVSDSRSEGITYTTADETARGAPTTLMIDNPHLANFSIGPKYFGLIDEWEIFRVREHVGLAPTLYYYPSGSGYSKVIDLENHSAQVNKVRVNGQEPANSKFLLYYAMSNDRNDFQNPSSLQWKRLKGNSGIFDNLDESGLIGRYIQFKIELFSDSKTRTTPSVQGLEVSYYRRRPPAPPSSIQVDNYHQGGAYIQWQPSVNNQVLGYKIFVGKYSTQYLEPGYPVDVGDDTSFLFSDLQPKVQYFFVIASYDKYGEIGPFSEEYSIRHIPD
ncbi:fibronectin type III domain-containing protein [Candidatus Haliotispira prima]|uniref:Fibronectin type III domain-containing protein n=1 Tax=Candidatus Haliotispira prima TaxID=3034016 RepID=A0ABY8MDV3_9SPIO|nr:fibronectin type III domain-containing protein [Candidatus Haliotispira prima]